MIMQAILLNGARCGETLLDEPVQCVQQVLAERGYAVRVFELRNLPVSYCLGCFECWTKTPGECTAQGANGEIARAYAQSDLALFLTPITFGGYSAELKKAIDHLICLISPFFTQIAGEVHHQTRYRHYPDLIGIGVQARPDADSAAIFTRVLERNALNMHAARHVSGVFQADDSAKTLQARLSVWLGRLEMVA